MLSSYPDTDSRNQYLILVSRIIASTRSWFTHRNKPQKMTEVDLIIRAWWEWKEEAYCAN